jgi:nucleotide-binding universal stress UspA family protein
MTTDTATRVDAAGAVGGLRDLFQPNRTFKLLLAIENDDNARAVIRVANALTARGALPTVVSATELMVPLSNPSEAMLGFAGTALDESFHAHRRAALRDLITATTAATNEWPITSVVGDAALSILDEAESTQADLVVMGIHHHGNFEQAIGENTATQVMGKASVAVLGVRRGFDGLPKRIMVATDFGHASREAAHVAANLAEPGGVVVLVNVSLPSAIVEEGDEGPAFVEREGIEHAFGHLIEEISKDKSIRVETVSRQGDAATELLAAAAAISPDVIAIASQRHRFISRLLLGSVTRTLARDGSWPMLVTPPRAPSAFARRSV